MKKLTIERAYELCIKKWEFIVDRGGEYNTSDLLKEIPELSELRNHCPYCELFINDFELNKACEKCPLRKCIKKRKLLWESACETKEHPFRNWYDDTTTENAQKVLDLIIETKPF